MISFGVTTDQSKYRSLISKETKSRMKRMTLLYVMLLLPVTLVIVFNYLPMYGVLIAFKNFRAADGIWGSSWNNFHHFRLLFNSAGFFRVLRNTVFISFLRLLVGFPGPILFALLLNELGSIKFKRTVQTISYLPYFMSWVVLGGIIAEVFSPQRGVANVIVKLFGGDPIHFLTSTRYFIPILIGTGIWQGIGWGAIIYLASLSSIDLALYESADIDGANRFQKALAISIPSLIPVMTVLFILNLGAILNAGFDQIFNLYNPLVYEVADILDTYIYRAGLIDMRYDFGAAVGLFKTVVGVILVIASNLIIRSYSDYGIW